jgi:RNA polymerase subunit RPABC4/transcription elongation factor Spt4/ribosomal protein L32
MEGKMETESGLFGTFRQCEFCHRALPKHYEFNLCPRCRDAKLFQDVRDYIRGGTVNEYDVAEHFGISVRQVKSWIRDGRIEYQGADIANTLSSMHCQSCGTKISFGTLCPKCLKQFNAGKGAVASGASSDHQMYYLDRRKF